MEKRDIVFKKWSLVGDAIVCKRRVYEISKIKSVTNDKPHSEINDGMLTLTMMNGNKVELEYSSDETEDAKYVHGVLFERITQRETGKHPEDKTIPCKFAFDYLGCRVEVYKNRIFFTNKPFPAVNIHYKDITQFSIEKKTRKFSGESWLLKFDYTESGKKRYDSVLLDEKYGQRVSKFVQNTLDGMKRENLSPSEKRAFISGELKDYKVYGGVTAGKYEGDAVIDYQGTLALVKGDKTLIKDLELNADCLVAYEEYGTSTLKDTQTLAKGTTLFGLAGFIVADSLSTSIMYNIGIECSDGSKFTMFIDENGYQMFMKTRINLQRGFNNVAKKSNDDNPIEQLEKLKKLLDIGAIKQEEYDSKKVELLARI